MNDYTAWLDGVSVAHGRLAYVRQHAREVFHSALWQEWNKPSAVCKVTRGRYQSFVESIILHKEQS